MSAPTMSVTGYTLYPVGKLKELEENKIHYTHKDENVRVNVRVCEGIPFDDEKKTFKLDGKDKLNIYVKDVEAKVPDGYRSIIRLSVNLDILDEVSLKVIKELAEKRDRSTSIMVKGTLREYGRSVATVEPYIEVGSVMKG